MTTWIRTMYGPLLNASSIERLSRQQTKHGYQWVAIGPDDSVGVPVSLSDDEVYALGRAVIPAQPGFMELSTWGDDEGSLHVVRHHVIGWRIGDLVPEPITLDDRQSSSLRYRCVLTPDGRCFEADWEFNSEQEWLASCRERHAEQRAKATPASR